MDFLNMSLPRPEVPSPHSKQPEISEQIKNLLLFLCTYLCAAKAGSHIAGRNQVELMVEATNCSLESLMLFVPLPQSSRDALT